MSLHAMWVHGNAVALQFPGGAGLEFTDRSRMAQVENHAWTDITGLRRGNGATFRGNGNDSNFFHFSIPTPVIAAGQQVYLDAVFVLYQTPGPEAAVVEVLAFDGPNPVPLAMLPARARSEATTARGGERTFRTALRSSRCPIAGPAR